MLKKKKPKHGISRAVLESAKTTTLHGIPFLVRSKANSTQFMWTMSLLAATAACAWMLLSILVQFSLFPIVTNILINQEHSLLFPAVTVCNHFNSPFYPDELIDQLKFQDRLLNITDITFRFNISFARGNGFFKCSKMNGGKGLHARPVDLLESRRLGRNEGLVIVFNTSFVDFPDSGKIFQYYMTDNRVQPTAIEINSFILFRDQEASVEIKKTVSRRLAYPHNNCQKREEGLVATDRTLIDKIADSDTDYLQETCFELCVEAHLRSVCNCTYYGVLRREDSYEESSDCNKV